MSYYAKVRDGVVVEVIKAEQDFFDTFIDTSPGTWLQTSYNTWGGVHHDPVTGEPDGKPALRKNFASVGFLYFADIDGFAPPKPYPSWLLDPETCYWYAPVPYPDDGQKYVWDEKTENWVPKVV